VLSHFVKENRLLISSEENVIGLNRMNEFIRSAEITQSVKQERRGTITACAFRCPVINMVQNLWISMNV